MTLVTRIIGDCPGCGAKNCFGNVMVHGDAVERGCMNCSHGYHWPLTPVHKKVLYLDQFFFSRAFRMKDPAQDQKYADAVARIKELALKQVLVVPYGSVHEDETHQWLGDDGRTRDDLMDFIKATSGGHELERSLRVQHAQVLRGFEHFLADKPVKWNIDPADALPDDLHEWTNYIWIDVPGYYGNIEGIRADKEKTVARLADILPEWRASTSTFKENLALELRDGAQAYMDAFKKKVDASFARDFDALWRVPYNASLIEALLAHFPDNIPGEQQFRTVVAFFQSEHFANTPYWWIWSHALAVLKERVKRGAYSHSTKGPARLSGYFDDIEFIGTYAPYCDAVFIDKAMEEMMRDPRLNLAKRFGVRVFSEANWALFSAWLDSLDANLSDDHIHDLAMAYPDSVANPLDVMRARVAEGNI
ncbi:MAG: hypothetical protein JNJ73_19550 [Hyphomonadaceae bacterium]|nr:hypothetical protein [Hyphomonadaceae bacterium]